MYLIGQCKALSHVPMSEHSQPPHLFEGDIHYFFNPQLV